MRGKTVLSPGGRRKLSREWRGGGGGYGAFALEPGKCEAVTAAHTGFLENMFQVDFDRAGLDAEHLADIAVAQSFFDQSDNFALAAGEFGTAGIVDFFGRAKDAVFHPGTAGGHGAQAREESVRFGRAPENALRASLEKPQCLILRHRGTPDN